MHHLAKYHISVSLPLFGAERTWPEIKHRQLTLLHRYTEMTNTQVSGFLFNCVSNDM